MRVTLVQFSARFLGEKLWKSQMFLSAINGSKRVARTCKMMKEVVDENVEKVRNLVHQTVIQASSSSSSPPPPPPPSLALEPGAGFSLLHSAPPLHLSEAHLKVSWQFFSGVGSSKLIMWKYWGGCMKRCIEKGLNFGPTIEFSTVTLLSVKKFLAQKSTTELEHPPYSLIRPRMNCGCLQK
jgi:hypothetical protein